jgi:carboxyl-terminal processing protease
LAGVKRGDRVLSWNGVSVEEWRQRTKADSSKAQPEVTQLVLRRAPTGDSMRVAIRRATWHLPAVTSAGLLTDSVGYVRVASITQRASQELEDAVAGLERRGARSLVLDLRGNGGGLFEEGVNAAALFLEPHAIVASLAGRGGSPPQEYRAKHSRWPKMPLTVLVDAGTASAAEVIAAALRDHGRALLVGAPTYGKGVVQRVVRLTPDLSLRLTTARWLMPSGRSLERRQGNAHSGTGGMQPDVLLDDPSWRDPSGVPRDWSATAIAQVVALADSTAQSALREGLATAPLAMLEARVRQRVALQVPREFRGASPQSQWVSVATRLATVRLLEIEGMDEALLRYAVREDGALHAGLDVVAPGNTGIGVLPTELVRNAASRVARAR